ncbi:MAG: acetyl-CoA carboxylase carboxyltransferase subunit beta [Candidatus Poribacteria bacterium]|nr:acetyl-CoA carboxylase carboxyltransferase subunit beta [Candidatus Poribacteria bacterium]
MDNTPKTFTCRFCTTDIEIEALTQNLKICPACDAHYPMSAHERLNLLVDADSFEETDTNLYSIDALEFPEYPDKLERDIAKTGLRSEMLTGTANIGGNQVAIAIGDVGFIGGTCGAVIGEKVTRCIEHACETQLPLIIVSVSGGMRMQEGTLALMQMAKTAAACTEYAKKGGFYISVMTDPTFGGATASYSSLGDVIVAEPGARIGFAGPLAVASLQEELPENFQKAESLVAYGFIDHIVHRKGMRQLLSDLISFAY